ncbi:hypothetical protein SAY87_029185 [Trapa incisa]|uniref:Uncharacterized protein n=1 Tax=Trapa incisa TaxID=236973 RepID=A0AAN7QQV4_9MYRT|nr:hypothetical protein SAY87_029185 [Trapa incisa]
MDVMYMYLLSFTCDSPLAAWPRGCAAQSAMNGPGQTHHYLDCVEKIRESPHREGNPCKGHDGLNPWRNHRQHLLQSGPRRGRIAQGRSRPVSLLSDHPPGLVPVPVPPLEVICLDEAIELDAHQKQQLRRPALFGRLPVVYFAEEIYGARLRQR